MKNINQTYIFNYPIEFTSLPDYSAHRGKQVKVLGECQDYDGPEIFGEKLYDIIALEDNWTGVAWESELC